jgi:hypothetical protein
MGGQQVRRQHCRRTGSCWLQTAAQQGVVGRVDAGRHGAGRGDKVGRVGRKAGARSPSGQLHYSTPVNDPEARCLGIA